MLTPEQNLTERALKANFTEVQQQYFDRLMSELEVISGGLGFAELKAKAEAGSKEALQVMRDYIVKKEQIVEFIETKEIIGETMSAEELCAEFRGEPVKVAKQRLHALMKTKAYQPGLKHFEREINVTSSVPGYFVQEQILGKIVAHMAGDDRVAEPLTKDIRGPFYDDSLMRLFRSNSKGRSKFHASTQFLVTVAFILEGKIPVFEITSFFDRLKNSKLYNNEKGEWNRLIDNEDVIDSQLFADDYLTEIMASYFLGKTEEVEKLYKEMGERYGEDFWDGGMVMETPDPDISKNERSKDLLLAVITQALVDDPEKAYERWLKGKESDLYDKEKQLWFTRKDHNKEGEIIKEQLVENEILDIMAEAIFIKLGLHDDIE